MQIDTASNNIFAQLHCPNSLNVGKMFISWARKMFMPMSVANSIKHDALKAMVVLHGPPDLTVAHHLRHDLFGKGHITADEVCSADWCGTHIISLRIVTNFLIDY